MPDNLNIDVDKTCAFTGHRDINEQLDAEFLTECLQEFIDSGYDTFLSGMARGFDLIAADAVLKLKEKNGHIKLIACVPCPEQSKYYPSEEKEKYDRILPLCDGVETVSAHYYNGCMQRRDRFMVDNSSLLIAYSRTREGGTFYTLSYAISRNKKVCVI